MTTAAKKSGGEDVIVKMFDYLDHAKKILMEEGYLQPTVFARTHYHDSLLVLPIVNDAGDLPDVAVELASKVIRAYNVSEYYVVSESYHVLETEQLECINIIYVGLGDKKLISTPLRRLDGGEFFFGETVEVIPSNVEGTILDLFNLRELTPRLTDLEKQQIRMLFPAQSDEEIAASNHTLH